MKLNQLFAVLLFVFILFTTSSCLKKGTDDPTISFRTRKQRIEGEWTVVSYFGNSVNQFASGQGASYTFKTDGSGSLSNTNGNVITSEDITWAFLGKDATYKADERMVIYGKSSSEGTIWEIRELKHNKIRLKRELKNVMDTISYAMTLEPK